MTSIYIPKAIANLGNTCFMNTILQIIAQCKELNSVLDSSQNPVLHTDITEYHVYQNWMDIRNIMFNVETKGHIVPRGFVNWFMKVAKDKKLDIFSAHVQSDTAEFLHFFMDCLHECRKKTMNISIHGNPENGKDGLAIKCYTCWKQMFEKDYSELKDMFYGITVSTIQSMTTNEIYSSTCEIYFTLDLPVVSPTKKLESIYECLDVFTETEYMKEDNAWYNDKTKSYEDVKKQIMFWNFPQILVICLKRFSMDGKSKETHNIAYPTDLDVSKYSCGYNTHRYVYELFGICNHFGNLYNGHYTNFVKTMDHVWYHCNDQIIQKVENESHVHTQYAYCLFYRKKNNQV